MSFNKHFDDVTREGEVLEWERIYTNDNFTAADTHTYHFDTVDVGSEIIRLDIYVNGNDHREIRVKLDGRSSNHAYLLTDGTIADNAGYLVVATPQAGGSGVSARIEWPRVGGERGAQIDVGSRAGNGVFTTGFSVAEAIGTTFSQVGSIEISGDATTGNGMFSSDVGVFKGRLK